MFKLDPITYETTPIRSSCDVLARYAEDGVAFARVIVSMGESDVQDWELGVRTTDIGKSDS